MVANSILRLFALSSLAATVCILTAAPVTALSVEPLNVHHAARGHDAIAKRKRGSSSSTPKRCRQRHSSSKPAPKPTTNSNVKDNSDGGDKNDDDKNDKPSSTKAAPKPSSTSKGGDNKSDDNNSGGNSGSSGPVPSNGSGRKLMLGWAIGDNKKALQNAMGKNTAALQSWSLDEPASAKDLNLKFFPTIWGEKDISKISSKLKGANGDTTVLTFNEPQEPGQSNLSPSRAASLWKDNIEPLRKKGYKLACPATSGNPNGITWMDDFFDACNGGCTCDVMGVHFYDTTVDKLKDWINRWRKYKKPIILSEFADHNFNGGNQPNNDAIWSFYTQAIPWLDSQDDILYYAPFGWFTNGNEGGVSDNVLLLKSDGSATDLGNYVKNF